MWQEPREVDGRLQATQLWPDIARSPKCGPGRGLGAGAGSSESHDVQRHRVRAPRPRPCPGPVPSPPVPLGFGRICTRTCPKSPHTGCLNIDIYCLCTSGSEQDAEGSAPPGGSEGGSVPGFLQAPDAPGDPQYPWRGRTLPLFSSSQPPLGVSSASVSQMSLFFLLEGPASHWTWGPP